MTRYAKVIDHTRCVGCHACTTACKSENDVPLSVTRTYVKSVDVGTFPAVRRAFQVTRCNQCDDAPCVTACPTAAMFRRPDGIVDFDKSVCIGCKACIAACPYDAIFINPRDHSAEKCNFCAHRVDGGLQPACVVVCPTEAIVVGDLDDPSSKVAQLVNRNPVAVRRPEKQTKPKLFYKGAHQATLDPLAARRPPGDLFAWATQPNGPQEVGAGHPGGGNSSAAALLSYDVSHKAPWDWRVGAYTWTKSIAVGAYLVAILLAVFGGMPWAGPIVIWIAPLVSVAFLALTGAILIWDLEHPERFLLIFLRPQKRSWLVKGAFIIAGYGLLLALHLLASLAHRPGLHHYLALAAVPLAILTAVYTGYLFAQAKARDLWQNPLLPPHLFVQALVCGSAILIPFALAFAFDDTVVGNLVWVLSASALVHLLFVLGEFTLAHPTAHARLAAQTLTRGTYAGWFWASVGLLVVAVFAPWLGLVAAGAALVGIFLYEHAYVQAGQSVPLA
ncbi:MAG: polysulfide reductase NrfD [Candidatus Eremiobacteraeota bacterium]|nr:polysulfide reductase NrfD [Candidatus Eremiobacteraeota bacterium]